MAYKKKGWKIVNKKVKKGGIDWGVVKEKVIKKKERKMRREKDTEKEEVFG